MKRKKTNKKKWPIRITIGIVLCLTLELLILPIKAELNSSGKAFQQFMQSQNKSEQLELKERKQIELYEKKYNELLFQQQKSKKGLLVPMEKYYKKQDGYLGTLSIPTVGIKKALIGFPMRKEQEALIEYSPPSSFPSDFQSSLIILRIKGDWSAQSLLKKLNYLKENDLLYLQTRENTFLYKIKKINSISENYRTESDLFSIREGKKECAIVYQTPFTGPTILIAEQVPKESVKKIIKRRPFISYSQLVALIVISQIAFFALLVLKYRRIVPNFFKEATRVKGASIKSLYTLLQVTRAYYVIFALAIGVFYFFLGYVYLLF